MKSVKQLIEEATDALRVKGISNPRREAEALLATSLNRKRLDLFWNLEEVLEEKKVAQYREWVRRRGKKEPFAYIVGKVEFFGLHLKVNRSTLIPRQETEILTDQVIRALPDAPLEVWDLCCGNGCLGLSIKKRRPACHVKGSDLSKEAVKVARENAKQNGLPVLFLEGDLLSPFIGRRSDVVVCNPPYVTPEEYEELEEEVQRFEPKSALVGGLDFYRRLSKDLPYFLNSFAKVFLEIGCNQGKMVDQIFSQSCWIQRKCEKDWAGHDRFFFLEYRGKF